MIIGNLLGGRQGMIIAFFFAVIMNFGSYWFSDKIVLKLYRARPVSETEAPELHRTVRQLTQQAGLPMPKVCIMPSESPNAFATGRNPQHAVVAVTQGILRLLNDDELKGVLAHELAHVKHRDILIGSIAATLAGAIMMIASMARWAALFGGFVHSGAYGGHAYPDGHIPVQGVCSRCGRCVICGKPSWSGQRPAKDIFGFAADTHEGKSFHGPHVYHESIVRQEPDEPFQHPSPSGKENRKTDRSEIGIGLHT
jgi:hypothetical protein